MIKVIETAVTKDGDIIQLTEARLTDGSLVYDLRIADGDLELLFKTACYDFKDAEKRFNSMKKALAAYGHKMKTKYLKTVYLKTELVERYNLKRAWFARAYVVCDENMVPCLYPWSRTKKGAREVCKKLNYKLDESRL